MASSAGLRERKAKVEYSGLNEKQQPVEEEDTKKTVQKSERKPLEAPDFEPDFKVAFAIVSLGAALMAAYIYYKVDNRPENKGPFAAFVNHYLDMIEEMFVPKNHHQK